jgi:hypothetical protein
MDKLLEEYLMDNYASVLKEYYAYLNRKNLPKVGERVMTLRSGFGGYAGCVRRVKEIQEEYILLSDDNDWREYLSKIDVWYKDIVVI